MRWFDIRLRFDKAGNPVICHGLMEYKFPQGESLELAFAWLAEQSERVQVSMKLEERTDDGNDTQEWLMRSFASRVIAKYGDRLLFENICRMRDWSILFPVASELLNYSTYVDFGSAPINSRNKWWSQCCPWLYAKVYNAKHCVDSAKYDMRMMDFVTYTL
ncbi:hypothetical protein AGMMS49525_02650 [Bacteroidia bacterium]|nr:hypothetical protein AGMMS49525_02650 [Bacteroidia bacterium]